MKIRPKALPILTNADKARQKTNPQSSSPNQPSKPSQQTIMLFGCDHYPFPNQSSPQNYLLKTVVNVSLSTTDLQKIIQLSHPNIVSLRKIVRSGKASSNYAFCYEVVAYSLSDLISSPEQNMGLFSELVLLNLRSILRSVVDYLQKAGIFYMTRLQDIGVTQKGTIKVYIPPKTVFESTYSQSIHRLVNEIGQWWEQIQGGMNRNQFKKEKKTIQLAPPKLEDCEDFDQEDGYGQLDATIEKEMGDLLADEEEGGIEVKQSENVGKKSAFYSKQLPHSQIEKIGEQVRCMKEKAKKSQKQAVTKVESGEQSQPAKSRKRSKQSQWQVPYTPPAEPVHQNINCINIFNHPAPMTPPAKIHYNYLTSPMDQGDFLMEHPDHDEEYSQDTYDIEFETQFQPVTEQSRKGNKLRQTFAQRATNTQEYEEASPRKGAKREVTVGPSYAGGGTLQGGKSFTESAGPMQFKSIVHKVMKPHYNEIKEDESQKSSQPNSTHPKNQSQQRPNSNMTAGLLKSGDLVLQRGSNKLEVNSGSQCKLQRNSGKYGFADKAESILRNNSAGNMRRHGPLADRVRQALEKTRNAIELLNRVKSSQKKKVEESGSGKTQQ